MSSDTRGPDDKSPKTERELAATQKPTDVALANTQEEVDCAPAGTTAPAYATTITK